MIIRNECIAQANNRDEVKVDVHKLSIYLSWKVEHVQMLKLKTTFKKLKMKVGSLHKGLVKFIM